MRGAIRDTWELGFLWEFNPRLIVLLCLCKVGVLTANITEPIDRQIEDVVTIPILHFQLQCNLFLWNIRVYVVSQSLWSFYPKFYIL